MGPCAQGWAARLHVAPFPADGERESRKTPSGSDLSGREKEAVWLVPGGIFNLEREWQRLQLTYITGAFYFQSLNVADSPILPAAEKAR